MNFPKPVDTPAESFIATRMLDKLPHDVLVHLARSFEVVDRVVLSEVCRACRDATREARALDERCGVPVRVHGFSGPGTFRGPGEILWPGDKEFLSLASSSRLAWAREHGFQLSIGRTLFVLAAHVGSLEVFEELAKGVSKDDMRFALFGAAVGGKLDILKWLWSEVAVVGQPESWVEQVWWKAARYGHLHILEFLGGDEVGDMHWFKDCSQATKLMMAAVQGGHVEVLKWIHNRVGPLDRPEWLEKLEHIIPLLLKAAILEGKLEAARFILGTYGPVAQERGWPSLLTPEFTAMAGEKCDYDMLRWLLKEGCPFDSFTLELFATSGEYDALDVQRLKWAQEQGLQLSEPVMEAAIVRNDLASARWLHENGCPISDAAVYLALRHTRCADGMLQFLVEECGALFDSNEITCRDAIRDRRPIHRQTQWVTRGVVDLHLDTNLVMKSRLGQEIVEMIEYLRDRGCEWGDVMYHAVRVSESGESASEDSLVVMRWLHENGCPGLESDNVLSAASQYGTAELHLWMLSVLGPKEREELWVRTCSADEAENGPQSVAEWEDHLRREEEERVVRRYSVPYRSIELIGEKTQGRTMDLLNGALRVMVRE